MRENTDYPIRFEVDYPESPSRVQALLGVLLIKWVLLIPHLVILIVLHTVNEIVIYVGHWAVLITGSYPRSLFGFVLGVQCWTNRARAWNAGIADPYPPFTLSMAEDYPTRLEVDYPESPSRVQALLGVLLIKWVLLIPHLVVLIVLHAVNEIVIYVGHWAVLITGSYPRGLFGFVVGVQRWSHRARAWNAGVTDRYPPFSLR